MTSSTPAACATPEPCTAQAACTTQADVFQHPVVEEGLAPTTAAEAALLMRAAGVCASCPMIEECLFEAVARHDIAGFVAGTTPQERRRIRATLGVQVAAENLDTWAGVSFGGRPVDQDEVIRLRSANPDETLEQLAMRLGCSVSTVKRHLRRGRRGVQQSTMSMASALPSKEQVWDAAHTVAARGRQFTRAA